MIVKNFHNLKKLVLAWDPDYTKVTPAEKKSIRRC